jgi:hypothetical protein
LAAAAHNSMYSNIDEKMVGYNLKNSNFEINENLKIEL